VKKILKTFAFFPLSLIALLFFILSVIEGPLIAHAHGSPFLEFAPDISDRLKVSDVATPAQEFQPKNDFLGAFDLWVDNEGSAGSATFEIIDQNGSVVARKTQTIPHLPAVWSGNQIHVDLDNTISISSEETYRVRIVSGPPQLYLYYADKTQLLQHNTLYYSEYFIRSAWLGNTEQNFAFKIIIYEVEDTAPPIITNATTTEVNYYTERIEFNANEPIDFKIDYAPIDGEEKSTSYTGTFRVCEPVACGANLTVEPGKKTYAYTITAKDEWGNEGTKVGTFISPPSPPTPTPDPSASPDTTPGATTTPESTYSPSPDLTPPTITNSRIIDLTSNSVRISWTTNEAATSKLYIYKGNTLITTEEDATYELEHLLGTSNILTPKTSYTAKLESKDSSGNIGATSFSFLTEEVDSDNQNNNNKKQPNEDEDVSLSPENGGTLTWNTKEDPPEGFRIDIFDENNHYIGQRILSKDSRGWELDLPPGNYKIVLYKDEGEYYEKVGKFLSIKVSGNIYGKFKKQIYFGIAGMLVLTGIASYIWNKKRYPKPKKKKMETEKDTTYEANRPY